MTGSVLVPDFEITIMYISYILDIAIIVSCSGYVHIEWIR